MADKIVQWVMVLFQPFLTITHYTSLSPVVYNITIHNCIFVLQYAKPEAASAVLGS
jgi:hypothetical protein